MRWGIAIVLTVCAACGFDPSGTTANDGETDGAPASSADARQLDDGAVARVCDPMDVLATATPQRLDALNSAAFDRDPFLTPDGLTIYLTSDRGGDNDIYVAQRQSRAEPFSTPQPVDEINTAGWESRAVLTFDGLSLYMAAERAGGVGFVDIWRATRAVSTDPFSPPELVAEASSTSYDYDPWISGDGLRLYLSSSGFGGLGDQDIAMAERGTTSEAFPTPSPMTVVNSGGGDADPALNADETLILFQRGGEIYFATRADRSSQFGSPQLATNLNSSDREGDPSISVDGCEIYFYSDRSGGQGGYEIYVARLDP